MMSKKILVISAHPDDEILGCGGTIARLVRKGYNAYTLILGEGVTSRDVQRNIEKRKEELRDLKKQAKDANKILGVKEVFFCNFPDNRFDTIPLLDIAKKVEEIKNKVKPDIVFTHYKNDLNIDHQIVYKAVITATRPLPEETVSEIYSFEVLSSTEYNYPLSFSPDVFFDIKNTFELKLDAMKKYSIELKTFPHPRSIDVIKLTARTKGAMVNLEYAEAFKLVRMVK